MDDLSLDPMVLEKTAIIIERYCSLQINIIDQYSQKMAMLSNDWTDDQTLGTLLEEVNKMKLRITSLMEEICQFYPNYFNQKAEQIRNRPKL